MRIIFTRKNEEILVDDEDYAWLCEWRWHLDSCGYARRGVHVPGSGRHGKTEMLWMHRLVSGAKPDDYVDHADRNRRNNARANLRICQQWQNMGNMTIRPHSSRFHGVSWDSKSRGWRAQIMVQRKKSFLGRFTHEDDAARAYDAAAFDARGEFAHLNFPLETTVQP